MVYVLDSLLVECNVFIKCPSLNPLKIDGRAQKHARVQNMAPSHFLHKHTCDFWVECLYTCTHMSVIRTHMLPTCQSCVAW